MKAHPAAEIFPMLSGPELHALAESIKTHGQQHPIVAHQGSVLDGRNRLRACRMAKVDPWIEEWTGDGSPVAYVMACNLHRRHLSESQRALAAARASQMFEREAAARMRSGRKTDAAHSVAEQAAAMLNVSPRTVGHARRLLRLGTPGLQSAVDRGEVSVSAASAVAGLPIDKQSTLVRQGAGAIKACARELRSPGAQDATLTELVRLWKRAGHDVRRRFVEFIEQ